ncbi:MAG: hypothetical protein LBK07_00480, partial [Tannerella sp.]|nr:hypothetical protein [Tannerella sp.]
ERTPLTVTVTNSGTLPTGALTVAVTGIGPDTFLLSRTALGSIPVAGSDTFALAPATGLAAGDYAATVTVSGGNGITASFAVLFTVDKAAPAVADLDFDLSDIVDTGKPLPGIGVGAATGIEGLGEVTVKYDGFTAIPTLPGTYTVTADIAAGDNYEAITGLVLGTFTVYDLPMPVIRRRVTLLPASGLTTDPPASTYYISSGSDFTFTLTPDVPPPAGTPPQVQTNRAGVPDSSTGIRMTANADGSYTVIIAGIRQDIDVILSIPADNAHVADGALTVGTAPGVRGVANGRPAPVSLHVYNLAGTLIRRTAVPPGTTRLSVATGIYVVTDGDAFRRKMVVTR